MLVGVSSPVELVFEPSAAGHANPLDACADAALHLTVIGGGSVAVDGASVKVGEKIRLKPGARLAVGDAEFVVWRNEHAHA